jgi:uncharacterized protein YndB with AHSA1/START domain
MYDILHRVGIKASPREVYQALATAKGLSGWWTTTTLGDGDHVGGILQFRFGPRGGFDMKVLAADPDRHVKWQVVEGPADWVGTTISFDLKQEDDYTILMFKHQGWRQPVEFMHHCSTKWGTFLMSLKAMLETGRAAPFPNDVKIDNLEAEAA